MGGDKGPATVVAGLSMFLASQPKARAILHGPRAELAPMIAKRNISDRVEIWDAPEVVEMTDKPSYVLRNGKKTSMWSAVEAVRDGSAAVAVSCGNTGGLMAISMLRLRKAEGVNRPAIACLWPSHNPAWSAKMPTHITGQFLRVLRSVISCWILVLQSLNSASLSKSGRDCRRSAKNVSVGPGSALVMMNLSCRKSIAQARTIDRMA